MRILPTTSLALTFLGLAPSAWAQDSLQLNDSRFVTGHKMDVVGDKIVIHFPHGDISVPRSMVKEAVIKGAAEASLGSDDQSKVDQGLVKFEDRWMPVVDRDKLLEKRRTDREARIKEAMSHREWVHRHTLKTENFAFEYTIDPEVMKGYAELMEAYFRNFTKEWGIKKPSKMGRLTVCFYHDEDYFHQVSGAPQGVIGYFKFVEPLELDFFYDRLDNDLTVDVMFHETNHYLTTLIDPKFRYPSWVNESLAEYYGASAWDPKTKKMTVGGIQEGRLAVVQDAILANEWQGLEELIRIEHGQFQAIHYAWGWTFVHWLLENKDTAQKFKDFYLALGRDKSIKREPVPPLMKAVPADEQIRVLLKFLGAKDLKQLEDGWRNYVKGLQPSSGRGYFEAGHQALIANQPLRAQRLLRIALEKNFKSPMVYAALSRALYLKDQDEEAIATMKAALELDPLNAEFYLGLASAYRSRKVDDPEVKRAQWLALEVARATNDPAEYAILIDLGPEFTKPDPALAPGGGK